MSYPSSLDAMIPTDQNSWAAWLNRTLLRLRRELNERGVHEGLVSVNPGTVNANTTKDLDVTVKGIDLTDDVYVMGPNNLETGLIGVALQVATTNTLRIRFANVTTSNIGGAAKDWRYFISSKRHG